LVWTAISVGVSLVAAFLVWIVIPPKRESVV
jgi:hypothetical protein